MRRRLLVVAAVALVGVGAIRLAVTPTFVGGYRVIDDSTIALQVIGVSPTWRAVTLETETPSEVTVGVSEISLRFGPGFGDERTAYVVVALRDPLGNRQVIDASTGAAIAQIAP
jgi:hypothetical protein